MFGLMHYAMFICPDNTHNSHQNLLPSLCGSSYWRKLFTCSSKVYTLYLTHWVPGCGEHQSLPLPSALQPWPVAASPPYPPDGGTSPSPTDPGNQCMLYHAVEREANSLMGFRRHVSMDMVSPCFNGEHTTMALSLLPIAMRAAHSHTNTIPYWGWN